MLIGYQTLEKLPDLPGDFATTAIDAAMEIQELTRNADAERVKLQSLISELDDLIKHAELQLQKPDLGIYWIFGLRPTGLGIVDRIWRKHTNLSEVVVDKKYHQKRAVREAIEHVNQLVQTLDCWWHGTISQEKCDRLVGLCVELSKQTSPYRGLMRCS
jgi:hypothetical protein